MNAIILAAGLGSRFKEITQKQHKALLPLANGIPNLEQTIIYLKEADINEIHIVTGHLAEQFDFLQQKYSCHLIHNEFYQKYNSIYSFYCAIDHFGDSFVIDADVTIFSNVFKGTFHNSQYFLIQRNKSNKKEWIPIIQNNKIIDIAIDDSDQPSLLGISYWSIDDANKIKSFMNQYINDEQSLLNPALYWDNIPIQHLKELNVGVKILSLKEAYEIDDVSEYEFILSNTRK